MYCRFFGFRSPPFDSTPDPAFFFKTPDHEEALASLRYAVEHRKGFVLLTGEVGAGKTLLSRVLLERLRPGTRTAVITNTHLSAAELLWSLCREFGLPVRDSASQAELIEALEDFLLDGYANGKDAVVVLDEAQNLPLESLEQVRMLGNLEAHDAKLVQILILGQPELRRHFAQPAMRQLRQRIFRAFHLVGLNRQQTAEYIRHRLAVAGGTGKVSFAPEAIALIHQSAQGLPRGINQLCDNALLTAYARSQRCVTAEIVQTVIDEMQQLDGSASDDDGAARAQPSAAEPAASQPPGQLHSHLEDSQQRLAEISERLEQVGSVAGRLDELDTRSRQLADRLDSLAAGTNWQLHQQVPEAIRQARQALEAVARLQERLGGGATVPTGKQQRPNDSARAILAQLSGALSRAERLMSQLDQMNGRSAVHIARLAEQADRAQRLTSSLVRIVEAANCRLEQIRGQLAEFERLGQQLPEQLSRLSQATKQPARLVSELSAISASAAQHIEASRTELTKLQATITEAEVSRCNLRRGIGLALQTRGLVRCEPQGSAESPPAPLDEQPADSRPVGSPLSRLPLRGLLRRLRR